jgi:uncharacterized membrane protein YeiH
MDAAELTGTVVFAVSGVLAVAHRPLHWFGAVVVGIVTAVGGGTMRGLILGATPVFWVEDRGFLVAALVGSLVAIALVRLLHERPGGFDRGVQLADAGGLALFSVIGASLTLDLGHDGVVAVLCGLLTGVGGGVIRDLLAGQTPLIMRGEIYATAALAGVTVFVCLDELAGAPETLAAAAGMVVIFGLRLGGIVGRWTLPPLARA